MIVACMAVLKESGMAKDQAIPIYQKLLDHHGTTAEAVNANMFRALGHIPTSKAARAHLLEVCPELEGTI